MRGEVNVMQADILPVRSRAGRDRTPPGSGPGVRLWGDSVTGPAPRGVRSRPERSSSRPHAAHPEHRAQFVIGARHRWSTNSL